MSERTCPEIRELLDSYTAGELLVETNHEVLVHLRRCDACRREAASRQTLRDALRLLPDAGAVPVRLERKLRRVTRPRVTSRVMMAAATILLTLAGALTWQIIRDEPLNAAELLARASAQERTEAATPDVVRRVYQVEERSLPEGRLVRRFRVELWSDGAQGRHARRIFDESHQLVAGEWETDGDRRLYQRNRAPVAARQEAAVTLVSRGESWRIDLSAAQIAALSSAARASRVTDTGTELIVELDLETSESPGAAGVERAQLVLRPGDLHAIEQRLTVRGAHARERYEVRLRETERTHLPAGRTTRRVFIPDAELLPPPAVASAARPAPARPAAAPKELAPISLEAEIKVLYALHQRGLLMDGRASVSRDDNGRLIVGAPAADASAISEELRGVAGVAVHATGDGAGAAGNGTGATAGGTGAGAGGTGAVAGATGAAAGGTGDAGAAGGAGATAASGAAAPASATATMTDATRVIAERLERLDDLFARVPERHADVTIDTAAAWQSMVRDIARDIEQRARGLAASSPTGAPRAASGAAASAASATTSGVVAITSTASARQAVARLRALIAAATGDSSSLRAPTSAPVAAAVAADGRHDALLAIVRQAAEFRNPWPLDIVEVRP